MASLVLALTELVSTFQHSLGDVLGSLWAWILMLLNVVSALILYVLAQLIFGVPNNLVTALVVGFSFPVILRSPLTYFKASPSQEGQFNEKAFRAISDFYEAILSHCRREADIAQADRRAGRAERLAEKYDPDFLESQARHRIDALRDEALQKELRQDLEEALKVEGEMDRKMALALVLMEVSPQESIDRLLADP